MSRFRYLLVSSFLVGLAFTVVLALASIVLAQGTAPPMSPESIEFLYTTFGWPGLLAGMSVMGLHFARYTFLASRWETLPRWGRYLLGFLAGATGAGVAPLIAGKGVAYAVVLALFGGFAGIGIDQGMKTVKKSRRNMLPTSGRDDRSLKVEIK